MFKSVFRAFGIGRHTGDPRLDISVSELHAASILKERQGKENKAPAQPTPRHSKPEIENKPQVAEAEQKQKAERPPRPQRPSNLQRFSISSILPAKVTTAERIVSDYDLVKIVGESKTAVVSLAVNNLTHERVAIKRHPKRTGNSHVYREAAIQSQLDHPKIAALHGFAENESYLYLVQEYCAGGELFDAVIPDFGCAPHVARSYILQLCKAMAYMHSMDLAHRDLKPENIMLAGDKQNIKVIDFGLSEYVIPGAKYKQHIGTVPYMAVELWAHTSSGYAEMDLKAIDVWAAGVVLYCMMSGRFPWSEATSRSPEFRRYKAGDFTMAPWPELAAKQPAVLELLLHMLHLDPTQRWSFEQCADFIETKWIIEPPAKPARKSRKPMNLRIGIARKAIVDIDALEPASPSPLTLSPHPEVSTSDDNLHFVFPANGQVAVA